MVQDQKNSSGVDAHAFFELVEKAAAHPETFSVKLVELIRTSPEIYLPLLLKIVDGQDAAQKAFVGELFSVSLKSLANQTLLPMLDEENPERFAWAANVLTDLKEPQALPGLKKGLWSKKKPMVNAALRGLAIIDGKDALQAIFDFLFKSPDWVYFSVAIRYLNGRVADAVPMLLEQFPQLSIDRQAWVLKFFAETGDPRIFPLFSKVLAEQTLELGLFGISGLGKIGTPQAVQELAAQMNNPEWFIRKRVVEALGNCKCKEAVPVLLKALIDASGQVKAGAVESLSHVGQYDLDVLIKELKTSNHDLKVGLIKALGQIRDPRLVQPLVKTLEDRSTLFFAIDALGDLGFPESAPALETFLNDSEWFNRLNALEALGKLRVPHIRKVAEQCLGDANDMVRNAASRILTQPA